MWKIINELKNGILTDKWVKIPEGVIQKEEWSVKYGLPIMQKRYVMNTPKKYVRCLHYIGHDLKKGTEMEVIRETEGFLDVTEKINGFDVVYRHKSKALFSAIYEKGTTMIKTPEAEEIIQQPFKDKESIYNGPYNKTTLFCLPMLGLTLRNAVVKTYLKNVYLEDVDYEHEIVRPLFVLAAVKDFTEKDYINFCYVLRHTEGYKHEYDLGKQNGKNLVMFVFETKLCHKDDYYHFKAGRYSKFSLRYKQTFDQYINNDTEKQIESLMWGVVYKSKFRKDQIALHFSVKDNDGKVKDQKEYKILRDAIDKYEEIWEVPRREAEYFNYRSNG